MISSVSAGGPPPPPPPKNESKELTEEQSTELASLLEEYDASSLSDEDASEIVAQIQELGIEPSKELAETLTEAGFDPQGLAEQAGIESAPRPEPQQRESTVNSEALELLTNLLDENEEASSGVDAATILSQLQDSGVDLESQIVDITA